MRIVFVNLDKKEKISIENNTKYVLISSDIEKIKDYKKLSIKPIVILYNGSYVIDLDKNSVIIDEPIDKRSADKIIAYSNTHNVDITLLKNKSKIYEIKMSTNNIHRRLIIPYMFKDILPRVSTTSVDKKIITNNNKASLLGAIEQVLTYLKASSNYLDLLSIYSNVSYDGYLKDKLKWKGCVSLES